MATDERYPGGDTPQQWSRRGLSEHIRLELVALGILPGGDGNFKQPQDTRPFFESKREVDAIVEEANQQGPREPDGSAPDGCYWDGYQWVWVPESGKSEYTTRDDLGVVPDQFKFDAEHPPVHFEWIDGFKIGDRVYHPSDVTILIKPYPNYANGKD